MNLLHSVKDAKGSGGQCPRQWYGTFIPFRRPDRFQEGPYAKNQAGEVN